MRLLSTSSNASMAKREQEAALDAILAEMEKLAANPGLGSPGYGGPFEARLIYRFAVKTDRTTHYVQVVYKVFKKDRVIVVAGFRPVAL